MITISKARSVLGKNAVGLSDEQIEELLRECQVLAELFWDQQMRKTTQAIDRNRRNIKMVLRS